MNIHRLQQRFYVSLTIKGKGTVVMTIEEAKRALFVLNDMIESATRLEENGCKELPGGGYA